MHGSAALRRIKDDGGRSLANVDRIPQALGRDHFWYFRTHVHPGMLEGWFQYDVACRLEKFYEDYKAGLRPKLVLSSPPQHGKSTMMVDFIAWCLGIDPDTKVIFASYSDDLGERANSDLQRILDSPRYKQIFSDTRLPSHANVVETEGKYKRNSSLLEFPSHKGSFRNTTVNGQITGFSLDIGVIDDPLKGRAEATSLTTRNRTWNWLTDDFFSRFSDHAGMLLIATRWHIDDPIGRWLDRFPDTMNMRYAAIAEEDEYIASCDFTRKRGTPLFGEHKSLDFLMERKKLYSLGAWESLYQSNPIIVGGGIFPIEKLTSVQVWNPNDVRDSVRYWDKAGTADGGDYSAGVLMHLMGDGKFVVEHVARGQWSALDREQKIKFWAQSDAAKYKSYRIVVEQEPGSSGKESAESTIRNLAGYRVEADKVTGKKEIRAAPFASQVQGDNVRLCAGDWNFAFIDEAETFPNSKHKDQIDAASGAFAHLAAQTAYLTDYSKWV